MYTVFGGIKATFLTDYVHTVMILIIIFIFAFTAYSTNVNLGSPGRVYELLTQAAKAHPVDGNAEGSYLTMRSKEGAVFFVINIVGNFGKWLECLLLLFLCPKVQVQVQGDLPATQSLKRCWKSRSREASEL